MAKINIFKRVWEYMRADDFTPEINAKDVNELLKSEDRTESSQQELTEENAKTKNVLSEQEMNNSHPYDDRTMQRSKLKVDISEERAANKAESVLDLAQLSDVAWTILNEERMDSAHALQVLIRQAKEIVGRTLSISETQALKDLVFENRAKSQEGKRKKATDRVRQVIQQDEARKKVMARVRQVIQQAWDNKKLDSTTMYEWVQNRLPENTWEYLNTYDVNEIIDGWSSKSLINKTLTSFLSKDGYDADDKNDVKQAQDFLDRSDPADRKDARDRLEAAGFTQSAIKGAISLFYMKDMTDGTESSSTEMGENTDLDKGGDITCPRCNGTGKDPDPKKLKEDGFASSECTACQGHGTVSKNTEKDFGVGNAGPVPTSLLARQDLEGKKKKKTTYSESLHDVADSELSEEQIREKNLTINKKLSSYLEKLGIEPYGQAYKETEETPTFDEIKEVAEGSETTKSQLINKALTAFFKDRSGFSIRENEVQVIAYDRKTDTSVVRPRSGQYSTDEMFELLEERIAQEGKKSHDVPIQEKLDEVKDSVHELDEKLDQYEDAKGKKKKSSPDPSESEEDYGRTGPEDTKQDEEEKTQKTSELVRETDYNDRVIFTYIDSERGKNDLSFKIGGVSRVFESLNDAKLYIDEVLKGRKEKTNKMNKEKTKKGYYSGACIDDNCANCTDSLCSHDCHVEEKSVDRVGKPEVELVEDEFETRDENVTGGLLRRDVIATAVRLAQTNKDPKRIRLTLMQDFGLMGEELDLIINDANKVLASQMGGGSSFDPDRALDKSFTKSYNEMKSGKDLKVTSPFKVNKFKDFWKNQK